MFGKANSYADSQIDALISGSNVLEEEDLIPDKDDIVANLRDGVCNFRFRKADGTIREAFGTTNPIVIGAYCGERDPKKPVRSTPDSLVTFFDIEKLAWRSFNIESLLWWNWAYGS